MKQIFTFILLLAISFQLQAQCTNAPGGQFPNYNYVPTCIGTPAPISEFCSNDNFSVVTLESGKAYAFSSSVVSDYITITDGGGGTVLASGTGPVSYTPTSTGNFRFYSHASSACNSDGLSRTRYVKCGTTPTSVPNCAFSVSPGANATVNYSPAPTLTWFPNPSSQGYSGFKVYVGTSVVTATLKLTTTQTSAVITDLDPSTTYFWYIVPYNVLGDAVGCSSGARSFNTVAAPTLNCATAVNISACGVNQTATFTNATGLYNPIVSSCGNSTPGEEKLYTFTPAVTGNYSLNVTAAPGGFVSYYYKDATAGNCSNFGWTCIAGIGNAGTTPIATLIAGKTYYILLDKDQATAGSHTFNITCPVAAPANNDAPGAVNLTVGAGCTGAPYTNVGAFQSVSEPLPNCSDDIFATVWYKFTAPASGAVRISTDLSPGTNTDTKIGLYKTSDVNNYSNFELIGCDDDGGSSVGFGFLSVLYATDLTPGATYYVQVGSNDNLQEGTFCLAVDELNSTMLASTNVCADTYQTPVGTNTAYTGWVSLLNETSKLVAMVKNDAGGAVSNYAVAQNVRTGTSRFSSAIGSSYLNRNFRITNNSVTAANVKFFYLNAELTQLQAQAPSTTAATIGVAKQTETVAGCYPDLNSANGPITSILQTGNGSVGNVRWVTIPVTGFSNFYLYDYGSIVPIKVIAFNGVKQSEQKNYLYWRLSCVGSENNSIVVERSEDAQTFESIYRLQNLTSDQCNEALDFTDLSPKAGVNFYRLKFIDADGRTNYTQIISLVNGSRAMELISLAPNPVKQTTNLRLVSNLKSEAQISILNAAGALVNKLKVSLVSGENNVSLNLSQLAPGVYNIVVSQPNAEKQTIKLIKQ